MDFANTIFIIELKRPQTTISRKELEQGLQYRSFLKKHIGNTKDSVRNFEVYIIGKGIASSDIAEELTDSLESSRKVYVRTYTELLKQAIEYHLEFINKYEMLENIRERDNQAN